MDAAAGRPLGGHTHHVQCIAFSPDGRHIFDKTIRIWDVGTGATISKPLNGHTDNVISVAYSPDGRHIVSGSNDNTFDFGVPRVVPQLANL